jgi:hypothetical protein
MARNHITDPGFKYVKNGNFDVLKFYFSPHLAGYYHFNIKSSNIHPYISGGISLNYLASGSSSKYASFLYNETGENLQLTAHYLSYYRSLYAEAGISVYNKEQNGGGKEQNGGGPRYFLGFKYYFAGNMISGDYRDVQNGTVLYSDQVTVSGSY